MANEFIIKNGFHSKGDSQVTGSLTVTEGLSGSFSGSFQGDGSGLTGTGGSAFPFTGDAEITGSLIVSGSFSSFRVDTDNVVLGTGAAANIVNGAEDNVIIGTQAAGLGTITIAADKNVIIGYQAGYDLTGGFNNVYMGHQSGFNLTSGRYNIGIGEAAGYGVTDNWGNIHIGQNTGVVCDGAYNVNIGYYAGAGAAGATPDFCTFIGYQAGRLCHDTDWDIGIGYKALYNINDGNNNLAIGREAGYNITDGSGNIIIGSGSLGEATMTNQLRIGNGNSLTTISASLATGDIIFQNTTVTNLTASGNISASGNVYGVTGSFSHVVGNNPLTVGSSVTFNNPITASSGAPISGSFIGDGSQITNVPITWQWSMARNRNNQSSVDLRREDRLIGSNNPFITPVSCSLIYITAGTQNSITWIPEVYKNGVLADSFTITSNTKGSNTSSVTFAPLDEVYMRCNDTGGTNNVDRPGITCFFREIT